MGSHLRERYLVQRKGPFNKTNSEIWKETLVITLASRLLISITVTYHQLAQKSKMSLSKKLFQRLMFRNFPKIRQ